LTRKEALTRKDAKKAGTAGYGKPSDGSKYPQVAFVIFGTGLRLVWKSLPVAERQHAHA
jgi:hypothetical protein